MYASLESSPEYAEADLSIHVEVGVKPHSTTPCGQQFNFGGRMRIVWGSPQQKMEQTSLVGGSSRA